MAQKVKIYLFIFIFFLSCVAFKAYFNTFYNAKKLFREAEELYKKSNYNLSPQIKSNYENAIKKFLSVIKYYPNSPFVEDALYYLVISYLRIEDYTKAMKKFEELLKYAPDSKFCIIAFEEISKILLEKERYDDFEYSYVLMKNTGVFKKLKEEEREFYEINFNFLRENYEEAISEGESFLKKFKKSKWRTEVAQILIKSYLKKGMGNKAFSFLNEFYKGEKIENLPVSHYITLSDLYLSKGDTARAIETLKSVYKKTGSPEILFKMVELKKMKGEPAESIRIILNEFKDKSNVDTLKQRALFEIAETYDERDSLSKKEELLKEVNKISSYTSYGKRASAYISVIEKLKKIKEEEKNIGNYIALAEDYYIELSKPEIAEFFLKKAIEIEDSIYTPKAYYFLFFLQEVILKKKEEAEKTLLEFERKYPQSFYLDEIRRRIEIH